MVWVRERTIPPELPPHVGEVIVNFLRIEGATWSVWRIPTAVFSGCVYFSEQNAIIQINGINFKVFVMETQRFFLWDGIENLFTNIANISFTLPRLNSQCLIYTAQRFNFLMFKLHCPTLYLFNFSPTLHNGRAI
jgi:hypothetical protein